MSRRLLLLIAVVAGSVAAQDPPNRAGRLNFISGSVSFQPSGVNDWVAASINRPLTVGDQLFSDDGARAEVHVPGTAFQLGSRTAFEFLNLDDRTVQVKLSEGTLNVRVRKLEGALEVDTPNLAYTIDRPGSYRIDTNPDTNETHVTVRSGDGQVTSSSGGAFSVRAGQEAVVSGQDGAQYNIYAAPGNDDFDNWVRTRDEREDHFKSARYVSPDVVGYEDLDEYGAWQSAPGYGDVWIPRGVRADWAPYHDGHWAWVDPWGWSWVDDAPWGFAPFHYGRWASFDGRWGWVPGPVAVAPVYAPALVAWFGGGGVQVSLGFGGGAVGWFALGPRDVYIPAYQASPAYVTRINTTNTTIINNTQITNVYNNYVRTGSVPTSTYTNARVAGAAIAVPQEALAGARPLQQVARSVSATQLNTIGTMSSAPRVAPLAAAVMGRAGQGNVPRPAVAVTNRAVVAKVTPPAAPASFAQRQTLLAKNPGRPIPIQQQQQLARSAPAAARPPVRVVTQARTVTPTVVNVPRQNAAQPVQPSRASTPQTPQRNPAAPGLQQPAPPTQASRPPQQSTPQALPNRPAQANGEAPRAQPQPSRPFEPPAAQHSAPPAQATREQPRVQPQPGRPVETPAERTAPQQRGPAQATHEPPRVQPQPSRPVEPPAAHTPPQQRGPAQAAHEPPRIQPQPSRPVEPPAERTAPQQRGPAQATHEPPRAQPQPSRPVEPPAAQHAPQQRGPAQAAHEPPPQQHRPNTEPSKREERPPL